MKKSYIQDQGNAAKPHLAGALPEAPEQWWARLSPVQRAFAHEIARLIGETTETKRIEIRRERGEIRARFIHILKRPESGCVSAIVLPEVPAGWN